MALQQSHAMLSVPRSLHLFARTTALDRTTAQRNLLRARREYTQLATLHPTQHPFKRRSARRRSRSRSEDGSVHSYRTMRHAHSQSPSNSKDGDFVYKIGAAYVGKKNQFEANKDQLRFASDEGIYWIGGKQKSVKEAHDVTLRSGQDACFVSNVNNTNSVAWGVADGVGGWIDQGIDSAAFAHGICNYMAKTAHNFPNDMAQGMDKTVLQPLDLLQTGYSRVCADEAIVGGGSTACVAVADAAGNMSVANLGDSGFVQLRLNAVHHFSNPQTHAFNTPFQLSSVPPKILAQIEAFGGNNPFSDMPSDASVTHHQLRHGDVLVFGTDGVWDNMSPQDILADVSNLMRDRGGWTESSSKGTIPSKKLLQLTEGKGEQAGQVPLKHARELQSALAVQLTRQAKAMSLNTRRDGPFAKAVHQAYPQENYHGGKVDDIAVVVAVAIDRNQAQQSKL